MRSSDALSGTLAKTLNTSSISLTTFWTSARLKRAHLELHKESCDLQSLLTDALGMARPLAVERGVRLENEAQLETAVWGDPLRTKQVLLNLLSNAVKFTPAGGTVTVLTGQQGDQVAITVSDTGIGIPPEQHEAIFDRFHQVGSTTRGVREGTGLGSGHHEDPCGTDGGTNLGRK